MTDNKQFYRNDLEERLFDFVIKLKEYCKKVPKRLENIEYVKQVLRSGGSMGANYIEANEALSKKDFVYRVRISRKETKETVHWLRIINYDQTDATRKEGEWLIDESLQLKKILSAIIIKSDSNVPEN